MSSTRGSNKSNENKLVLNRQIHTPAILLGLLKEALKVFDKLTQNTFSGNVRGKASVLRGSFKVCLKDGSSPKSINDDRAAYIIDFYNAVINGEKIRNRISRRSPRAAATGSPRAAPQNLDGILSRANSNNSFIQYLNNFPDRTLSSMTNCSDINPDMSRQNSNFSDFSLGLSRASSIGAEGYITPLASPSSTKASAYDFSPRTIEACQDLAKYLKGENL